MYTLSWERMRTFASAGSLPECAQNPGVGHVGPSPLLPGWASAGSWSREPEPALQACVVLQDTADLAAGLASVSGTWHKGLDNPFRCIGRGRAKVNHDLFSYSRNDNGLTGKTGKLNSWQAKIHHHVPLKMRSIGGKVTGYCTPRQNFKKELFIKEYYS